MLPSLFVSHGAPTLPLEDILARGFLRGLEARIGRPKAILVASAHWETASPEVNAPAANETIHDFYGFPKPLYQLRYPAPGSAALARRVAALTGAALEPARGLDHGAWVPLMLAWPAADIPVAQLSIQTEAGPRHHLELGRRLAPLREEGVLVLGSGGFTHNLRALARDGGGAAAPEPPWVTRFSDWIDRALVEGRTEDLVDYRRLAPEAARSHPTEEHFLPLFVALGAGGGAERLHSSTTMGALRMDAYAFR
jgi:4,5-DOPA dioxygenase extradiol